MSSMLKSMYEMLCNGLNNDLTKANFRPYYTEQTTTNTVECSIKIMLGDMIPQGVGEDGKYYNKGWIYFDFGSNIERATLAVTEAIDELLDWLATNYSKGEGYTYSGTTIRDIKIIPFQGYAQPKQMFLQDMIMAEFLWERN